MLSVPCECQFGQNLLQLVFRQIGETRDLRVLFGRGGPAVFCFAAYWIRT